MQECLRDPMIVYLDVEEEELYYDLDIAETDEDLHYDLDVEETIVVDSSDHDYYTGDYVVTPKAHASTVLETNDKIMCAQLISGSTELTEELNFKSIGTSNSIQTLECTDMPTPTQLANAKLQCRLGYYGGAINGATLYVEYDIPSGTIDHYTYTFTVSEDATIAVTIGSVVIQNTFYRKVNGSWTELSVITAYKKVDGAWVQQSDWANAFDPNTNYVYSSS